MPPLDQPGVADQLVARLERLTPDAARKFGTMTPHEMLCHLADSYRTATGEHQASSAESFLSRTIIRFIALHTPMPWPSGVPTRPEVDPRRAGTRPVNFERDREALADVIRAFAKPREHYAPHPGFGPLTRHEWMIWGYRHADHHFRQFGI
jgi:hypothetical protein